MVKRRNKSRWRKTLTTKRLPVCAGTWREVAYTGSRWRKVYSRIGRPKKKTRSASAPQVFG